MDLHLKEIFFSDPTGNGVTDLVLGILFILSSYHIVLYVQNKNRAFLLYSLYTFLIFCRHSFLGQGDIFDLVLSPFRPWFIDTGFKDFIVWIYTCIYFYFIIDFVDLRWAKSRVNKVLISLVISITAASFLSMAISFFQGTPDFITESYTFIFLPVAVVASLLGMYALLQSNSPVRWYALVGSIALLSSSLIPSYLELNGHVLNEIVPEHSKFNVFYIGLVIENFLFALGLGQKERIIMRERNKSQENLIAQLKENESLREALNFGLEKKVQSLSRRSEEHELERLKAEHEQQLIALKISSLRNQMNPHFIFNSLNSIKLYIINQDTTNAVYYLNKFSKLIRKILATTQEASISLEEELETAELYMSIENIRFNNELQFQIEVEEGLNTNGIKLPPLVLQPFIENSIWHGLSMREGDKILNIRAFKKDGDYVVISIQDNGIGREKAAEFKNKKIIKKDSIGMKLTQERMEHFTQDKKKPFQMHISDIKDGDLALGTRVELEIPLN